MSLKTYNPKDVSLIVSGQIIEGFADGTFVGVARNNDSVTYQRGAQGGGSRVISNDKSGRITITLQQTSPSNGILSALQIADELNGGGVFSALVKDNSGNDIHAAKTAWVMKPADSEYGNELSNREWIIETDELDMLPLGQSN